MSSKIGLGIIVIAVIALAVVMSGILTVITDQKTALKGEYNTYWADATDDNFYFNSPGVKESQKFACTLGGGGLAYTETNDIAVGLGASCTTKQSFTGQETVLMIEGGGGSFVFGNYQIAPPRSVQSIYYFVPHTLEKKYDVFLNGKSAVNKVATFEYEGSIIFNFGAGERANVQVYYIGYKAQYSCDISNDEVWIQENFAQPFSIKDVEFIPTKFCKETRPFILRDIQQGETPIYPDPIPTFNKGGVLGVPLGKIGVVNYATYFVSGVNNKCAPNEANIKVAGRWICSQVIKPVEVIVQCQQDSDCPQPLKNNCPGYFIGCKNQKCTYDDTILNSLQCKNEVVTIVKQIETVQTRELVDISDENSFIFTGSSFNIGDMIFTTITQSTCGIPSDVDFISFPSPNADCYISTAAYDGKIYSLKDKQFVKLTPNIAFTHFISGGLKRSSGGISSNLGATYYFVISNPLSLSINDGSELLKNSIKDIELNIFNNLANGNAILKIQQQAKQTNQFMPEQKLDIILKYGENKVVFRADTSNLGINQFLIQAFYRIDVQDREILIPSDKWIFNYNVVDKLSGIETVVVVDRQEVIIEKNITKIIIINPITEFLKGLLDIISNFFRNLFL